MPGSSSSPTLRGGTRTRRTRPGWRAGSAAAAAIVACVIAGRFGPPWFRAAIYGTAAAIAFAFTAALMKVVADYVATDWVIMFRHWETYGMAVFGVAGVFLVQNAYLSGPIAASQSTIVLVDPLVSILLGIGLFGDELRTGGAYAYLEAISLIVLASGALLLCSSPLVAGVKAEGEQRSDLLGERNRRALARSRKALLG